MTFVLDFVGSTVFVEVFEQKHGYWNRNDQDHQLGRNNLANRESIFQMRISEKDGQTGESNQGNLPCKVGRVHR